MKKILILSIILALICLTKGDLMSNSTKKNELLWDAVRSEDSGMIKEALRQGADVNARYDGQTPLHYIAESGSPEIAQLLVKNGANVNAKDGYGKSPLHYTTRNFYGRVEIARLLVEKGAAIDAKDNEGKSALYYANEHRNVDVIVLLRKKGAAPVYARKMYLARIDAANGSVIWKKYAGEPFSAVVQGKLTSDSGFILAGYKETRYYDEKPILVKTDKLGNTEWIKTYSGNGFIRLVEQSPDGGYALCIQTRDDKTSVIRTDREGNQKWQRGINFERSHDTLTSFCFTDSNEILLTVKSPWMDVSYELNKETTKKFSPQSRLLKIDSRGDIKPVNKIDHAGINSIIPLEDGTFMLAGKISPPEENGDYIKEFMFLAKVDKEGAEIWRKTYGKYTRHKSWSLPVSASSFKYAINSVFPIWYQRWKEWDNDVLFVQEIDSNDIFLRAIAKRKKNNYCLMRVNKKGRQRWKWEFQENEEAVWLKGKGMLFPSGSGLKMFTTRRRLIWDMPSWQKDNFIVRSAFVDTKGRLILAGDKREKIKTGE